MTFPNAKLICFAASPVYRFGHQTTWHANTKIPSTPPGISVAVTYPEFNEIPLGLVVLFYTVDHKLQFAWIFQIIPNIFCTMPACGACILYFKSHDDVIKWKHFSLYWPVNSPHKGQWRGALLFSVIFVCVWINGWVNNREAGDLRRHLTHDEVIVMCTEIQCIGAKWAPWCLKSSTNGLFVQQLAGAGYHQRKHHIFRHNFPLIK